jgi:hypothetical protein
LTNIFYLNTHVSNFSFPQTSIFNSLEHFSLIRFANLVKNKSGGVVGGENGEHPMSMEASTETTMRTQLKN